MPMKSLENVLVSESQQLHYYHGFNGVQSLRVTWCYKKELTEVKLISKISSAISHIFSASIVLPMSQSDYSQTLSEPIFGNQYVFVLCPWLSIETSREVTGSCGAKVPHNERVE